MPNRHAKALDVMSSATNYNNWIFNKIKPHLGTNVLEIGCGIGNFTKFLTGVKNITAVDMSQECIKKASDRFNAKDSISFVCGDFLDNETLNKINNKKYDTIICLNVLEHIAEDKDALLKMHLLLDDKGKLILIVPAMQRIYGTLDASLGHIKRYDKRDLTQVLDLSGFLIRTFYYFNFLGIFGWFLNGRILKKSNLSLIQALIYDKIFIPVISKLEELIRPPFGMSLFVVATKKQSGEI